MSNTVETVRRIWERIELLGRIAQRDLRLGPGASDEQIAEWQRVMNVTLPEDVQASYRHHDGQQRDSDTLIDEWSLLPWQGSVKTWTKLNEVHGINQSKGAMVWDRHWVPVTMNGLGDHHVIDLSKHGDGKQGRLILFNHESIARPFVAESFLTWLEGAVRLLELDASYSASKNSGQGATPSMRDLMRLIGLSLTDHTVQTLLSTVAIERERDGSTVTLRAAKAGFDITCDRANITQIDFYLSPSTGEALYAGTLVAGVSSSDHRSVLREKLGIPTESDKQSLVTFNTKAGWDAYRMDDRRVQFTFRPDWKGISWITVT